MRDEFARYWVIVPVTLLAAGLAWVHGGARVEYLAGVPWISLAILEMLFLAPPPRRDESLDEARVRTRQGLLADPLLYIGIALCVYLLLQVLNGGCKLIVNPDSGAWEFSSPPVPWGPFCVDPSEARSVLYWFPAALAVALGIRHGSNRRTKAFLLRAIVANGALLALVGLIQNLSGTPLLLWMTPVEGPFFASFASPNHAGAFFFLLLAVNIGLLLQSLLNPEDRLHALWLGTALILNLTGACLSSSWAAILASLALVVLGGIYALRHIWPLVQVEIRLKATAIYLSVLLLGFAFLFFAAPENPVLRQLEKIPWSNPVGELFYSRWPHTAAAASIWRHHLWFGVGAGGYRHFVCLDANAPKSDPTQAWNGNVRNDPMQFLAEHGLVGFGLMLAAVSALVIPFFRRLWLAHETQALGRTGDVSLFFRLSPVAVTLFAGVLLVAAYSLIDLPFRSPAVLITWVAFLACAPAFLSARRDPDPTQSKPREPI